MDKRKTYKVKKVISNNAVLAVDQQEKEVILLGKGIGFNQKKEDLIPHTDAVEKVFIPSSAHDREELLRLFQDTDEEVMEAIHTYIRFVEQTLHQSVPENFLLSFIDHLSFAITRLKQGIRIYNPFLHEVQCLYPKEYSLAEAIVPLLRSKVGVDIPEEELGFITLHLRSVQSDQSILEMNRFSQLIATLISLIEQELEIHIEKSSINYARLVTHLRYTIERAEKRQHFGENPLLSALMVNEYPLCYNLAYRLVKIMQNELKVEIPEAEVSYLTLHIQRLAGH